MSPRRLALVMYADLAMQPPEKVVLLLHARTISDAMCDVCEMRIDENMHAAEASHYCDLHPLLISAVNEVFCKVLLIQQARNYLIK